MKKENREARVARTLTEAQVKLILEAQIEFLSDPFFTDRNGGHAKDVHARLVGYFIDREVSQAFPVFETDNGLFAMEHDIEDRGVTSWAVKPEEIYCVVS